MSPRVHLFQVIGARGVQLDREPRRPGARELLGVNARHESAGAPRRQNPPRLRHRERAAVAEDVAELGEPRGRNGGNPALHQQVHIRVGPSPKFRRNDVRAEKRADDIERLLLMQLMKHVQNLQLALPIEAVTALGFERSGAVRGKLAKMRARSLAERFRRSAAAILHRGADSAACAGNLLVGFSGNSLLVFGGAARRKNQVRVRIDEAGKNDASAKIQFLGAAR